MKASNLNRRNFIKTTMAGTILATNPNLESIASLTPDTPSEIEGNKVHIWLDMMPRAQSAASYTRLAKKYYADGADGLCFWDGERRTARISEWASVQRLGHKDMLDQLVKEGPSYYRAVALKILGGFDVKWSFKDG